MLKYFWASVAVASWVLEDRQETVNIYLVTTHLSQCCGMSGVAVLMVWLISSWCCVVEGWGWGAAISTLNRFERRREDGDQNQLKFDSRRDNMWLLWLLWHCVPLWGWHSPISDLIVNKDWSDWSDPWHVANTTQQYSNDHKFTSHISKNVMCLL